jgi:NAD(P)-dependent dehydrogenase (short-subunit alcohol dehydrogenase family)
VPGYFEIELTTPLKSLPLYEEVIMRTAADRWGNPDECTGTAVFLAAPASDFGAGQVFVVDCGRTLV